MIRERLFGQRRMAWESVWKSGAARLGMVLFLCGSAASLEAYGQVTLGPRGPEKKEERRTQTARETIDSGWADHLPPDSDGCARATPRTPLQCLAKVSRAETRKRGSLHLPGLVVVQRQRCESAAGALAVLYGVDRSRAEFAGFSECGNHLGDRRTPTSVSSTRRSRSSGNRGLGLAAEGPPRTRRRRILTARDSRLAAAGPVARPQGSTGNPPAQL